MTKHLIMGLCLLCIFAGCTEKKEEETVPDKYKVVITNIGDRKISLIKVVREITELGLKDAKDLVESPSPTIKEGLSKKEAEEIALKLKEAGATVEIKPE